MSANGAGIVTDLSLATESNAPLSSGNLHAFLCTGLVAGPDQDAYDSLLGISARRIMDVANAGLPGEKALK